MAICDGGLADARVPEKRYAVRPQQFQEVEVSVGGGSDAGAGRVLEVARRPRRLGGALAIDIERRQRVNVTAGHGHLEAATSDGELPEHRARGLAAPSGPTRLGEPDRAHRPDRQRQLLHEVDREGCQWPLVG